MAAVKIQYTQGATVGAVGRALVGTTGTKVTAQDGNAIQGESAQYRWSWVDVPTTSAFVVGPIIDGPIKSISFIPDAQGDYHLMVEKHDILGFRTVDKRVFRVLLTSGRALPAFDAEADALNFGGQLKGWKPDMETWLLYLDSIVGGGGGGSSVGGAGELQASDGSGAFQATGITGAAGALHAAADITTDSDLHVLGAAFVTGNLNVANITATGNITAGGNMSCTGTCTAAGVISTSYMAAGTSPATSGTYRAPSVAAQLLVAGTKTIIGTGSTDAYFCCDSSFLNQVSGTAYIFPGTRISLGIVSTQYMELVSGEVRMAVGTGQNWSFGASPSYGGGVIVGFRKYASTKPSANPSGGVVDYADADDGLSKVRMVDGRVATIDVPNPGIMDLRLSPRTGEPIPTTTTASVSTIYLTPFRSGAIMLYNTTTSTWNLRVTGEISLALTGLTSGKNYDVFAYWTGSAVALELSAAWTNDTTRADGVERQDGVLVKTSNHTRRLVGTIRATGATTSTDTLTQRYVANLNQFIRRTLSVADTTASWTQSSSTWRVANNTTTNHIVEMVVCDWADAEAKVSIMASQGGSNGHSRVGIGVDSTTVDSAFAGGDLILTSVQYRQKDCSWSGLLSAGYHYLAWLEQGENTTTTWFGDGSAVTRNARLRGSVTA